jgi:hypothetical protein
MTKKSNTRTHQPPPPTVPVKPKKRIWTKVFLLLVLFSLFIFVVVKIAEKIKENKELEASQKNTEKVVEKDKEQQDEKDGGMSKGGKAVLIIFVIVVFLGGILFLLYRRHLLGDIGDDIDDEVLLFDVNDTESVDLDQFRHLGGEAQEQLNRLEHKVDNEGELVFKKLEKDIKPAPRRGSNASNLSLAVEPAPRRGSNASDLSLYVDPDPPSRRGSASSVPTASRRLSTGSTAPTASKRTSTRTRRHSNASTASKARRGSDASVEGPRPRSHSTGSISPAKYAERLKLYTSPNWEREPFHANVEGPPLKAAPQKPNIIDDFLESRPMPPIPKDEEK